jgi:hypothetical protein
MSELLQNFGIDNLVPPDAATLEAFWTGQQDRLTATLAEKIPDGSTVAMLDYQVHSNTGDHLIMLGTECWVAEHRFNVLGTWHVDNFLYPALPREAILVSHGGGNLGDLYRYQHHREKVVRAYPHNRIVILPQTIFFQNAEKLQQVSRTMNTHADLHLFVRDQPSLQIAERAFAGCAPTLAADMATFLFPLEEKLHCKLPTEIAQEMFFLERRDKERIDLSHVPALRGKRGIDWNDLQPMHGPFITGVMVTAYVCGRFLPAIDFPKMFRAPLCCYGTERFTVSRHENRDFTGGLGKMKQGTVDFRLQVRELGEVL